MQNMALVAVFQDVLSCTYFGILLLKSQCCTNTDFDTSTSSAEKNKLVQELKRHQNIFQ
jgi:hypothetical protein